MKFMRLKLSEFVEKVYKYDIEKLYDFDNIDTSWVKVEDHEVEEVREKYKLGEEVDDETIRESIDRAKSWAYERTYTDEYAQGVRDTIKEKLKKDFENLQDFFEKDAGEFEVKGKLSIKKIDWENDEIVFEGKLTKLEAYIINACNGYGMFRYESLEDFRYAYGGYDVKKRIESHLHWLKYMEDIYGTIYNFFKLDLSHVDYYGTLGNTGFEEDDIIDALSDQGILVESV